MHEKNLLDLCSDRKQIENFMPDSLDWNLILNALKMFAQYLKILHFFKRSQHAGAYSFCSLFIVLLDLEKPAQGKENGESSALQWK